MKIVLDTNVLVSALLSPFAAPAQITQLVLAGVVRIALDERILAEYKDVLNRPHFSFRQDRVKALLDYLTDEAEFVATLPLSIELPDKDDISFIEVAVTAQAGALVTGNSKHFPKDIMRILQVTVLTPAQCLKLIQ